MTAGLDAIVLSSQQKKQLPYLVDANFDLLFVCGGFCLFLTLLYCGLASRLTAGTREYINVFLLAGTYLLSQPHLGATLVRLYGEPENRRAHPLIAYALPIWLVLGCALSLYLFGSANTMHLLVGFYMAFIVHHVLAQSYGIALMYCGRAGFVMTVYEKELFKGILYTAIAVAIIGQYAQIGNRSLLPGYEYYSQFALPYLDLQIAIGMLFSLIFFFAGSQIKRYANNEELMPLPAVMTMGTAVLAVILSQGVDLNYWLFMPAFFHASQYLAVVLAYKWKDNLLAGCAPRAFAARPLSFCGFVMEQCHSYLLVGLLFSVVIPCCFFLKGFNVLEPFKTAFLLLSLHHFAADACLWKFRRRKVAERLLSVNM
jgi:hypothetical protein